MYINYVGNILFLHASLLTALSWLRSSWWCWVGWDDMGCQFIEGHHANTYSHTYSYLREILCIVNPPRRWEETIEPWESPHGNGMNMKTGTLDLRGSNSTCRINMSPKWQNVLQCILFILYSIFISEPIYRLKGILTSTLTLKILKIYAYQL